MRKLHVFNMVTLDGFFEGPGHDISWHNVDAEFNEFAVEQLNSADLLMFGRVTYELMASYWPTPAALNDDPVVTKKMNSIGKIVFSTTMKKAEWNNTRLIKENAAEEISKLKQQPGKNIFVFGSGNLTSALMKMGLIDEFRVIVNPIVLGKGTPMFNGLPDRTSLKLLRTKTFHSGNVLLCYEPSIK